VGNELEIKDAKSPSKFYNEKGVERNMGDDVRIKKVLFYRLHRDMPVQKPIGGKDQAGIDAFRRYDFGK